MNQNKPPKAYSINKRRAALILSLISAAALILTAVGVWCLRHYLTDPAALRAFVDRHYFVGALLLIIVAVQALANSAVPFRSC